jgi:hypothetical protein
MWENDILLKGNKEASFTSCTTQMNKITIFLSQPDLMGKRLPLSKLNAYRDGIDYSLQKAFDQLPSMRLHESLDGWSLFCHR